MTSHEQKIFYSKIGKALTDARKNLNMDIPKLVKLSGEQYKTIQSIESGKVCSLHHLSWMKSIFNIDVNKLIKDIEGNREQESKTVIDRLI